MSCELRTLLFTAQPARAQLVNLQASWQRIIQDHAYPTAVRRMLGELVAASTLLSASLKFNGSLILQIKGDGPVGLVVAECTSDLGLRATAMFDRQASIADDASFQDLVNAGGKGRFVLILDPRDRLPGQQPYQGIIALQGHSVADAIEEYMRQSEQLQTRLWLQGDDQRVSGLLLQQMPNTGGVTSVQDGSSSAAQPGEQAGDIAHAHSSTESDWDRLVLLSNTLKPGELNDTDTATMAKRLFWQESHQTLLVRQPQFRCTCSRDKVTSMLKSLGEQEVNEALAEQGTLTVNCDYCNTAYGFDRVDCAALFSNRLFISDENSDNKGLH